MLAPVSMGFMAGNRSTSLMSNNTLSETNVGAKTRHGILTRRIGKEHDQSIDAHSPASSGRKTVFQPDNKHVNESNVARVHQLTR